MERRNGTGMTANEAAFVLAVVGRKPSAARLHAWEVEHHRALTDYERDHAREFPDIDQAVAFMLQDTEFVGELEFSDEYRDIYIKKG